MERAGSAAFRLLRERWPEARRIEVLCGPGNNGGDGYVLARLAQAAGLWVRVHQLGDAGRLRGDAELMRRRYLEMGGALGGGHLGRDTRVLVDGVFGTGLEREVSGPWAQSLAAMAAHPAPVLGLDIPSGLHADSGRVLGVAVPCAATLSFIGLKRGLFTGAGPDYCGEVLFDGLEVPAALYARQLLSARRLDWGRCRQLLSPRPRSAHKGRFGHVLVVGGCPGYSGAARLAGEGALRAGAGLVSLAVHPGQAAGIVAGRPELMVHEVARPADLEPLLERATQVVVGPGLGRGGWARGLWREVSAAGLPLVVDADALNLLAVQPRRLEGAVLTPHPGEAARLLGIAAAEVQADRFAAAEALWRRFGGVVVLKGAGTLIHAGGQPPVGVCTQGNPGMASGGMGDVLSGIIAGLLAQGLEARDAAELGVCLHGAAGDRAAEGGERGLLASDLLGGLRALVNGRDAQGRADDEETRVS